MVVVHNYYEKKNSSIHPDSSPEKDIDEDKAYAVGIWVFAGFIIVLIVVLVLFAVGRTNDTSELASEEKVKEEVLGEKETKVKKPANTETELKESKSTKEEESNDIDNLERPLSQEEIIAKADKTTGSKLHTVASGDSLYTIGEEYGVSWQDVAEINNLAPPYNLSTGLKIIIPPKGVK